jgi:hypothetical protein
MAVVSVFADNGAHRANHVAFLSLAFFGTALPCMTIWAVLGSSVNQWLRSTRTLRNFNRSMGLLLAGSTWLSAWMG